MGLAIVEAALALEWPVTLLLGPGIEYPSRHPLLEILPFGTASELGVLLKDSWPGSEILIMAAAVADFRPKKSLAGEKMKRNGPATLELEPVEDLVAELDSLTTPSQVRIGFALEEPEQLVDRAREKLEAKGLDAIVANPLTTMDSDTIEATLLHRDGQSETLPGPATKRDFADWLLHRVDAMMRKPRSDP